MTEYKYYGVPGTRNVFRVSTEPDYDAESPRDWENVTAMVTVDRSYNSPDGKRETLSNSDIPDGNPFVGYYGIDPQYVGKYLALYGKAIGIHAWAYLKRESRDGTFALYESKDGDAFHHFDGLIIITTDKWTESMITERTPLQIMEQDVEIYNQWAQGYFEYLCVEMLERWNHIDNPDRHTHTWEHYEGLGGVNTYESADLEAEIEHLLPANAYELTSTELAELMDEEN